MCVRQHDHYAVGITLRLRVRYVESREECLSFSMLNEISTCMASFENFKRELCVYGFQAICSLFLILENPDSLGLRKSMFLIRLF